MSKSKLEDKPFTKNSLKSVSLFDFSKRDNAFLTNPTFVVGTICLE
jgi:hypothetical protein